MRGQVATRSDLDGIIEVGSTQKELRSLGELGTSFVRGVRIRRQERTQQISKGRF